MKLTHRNKTSRVQVNYKKYLFPKGFRLTKNIYFMIYIEKDFTKHLIIHTEKIYHKQVLIIQKQTCKRQNTCIPLTIPRCVVNIMQLERFNTYTLNEILLPSVDDKVLEFSFDV